MKLLPATSSFLFVILLFLFFGCKTKEEQKRKIPKKVYEYELLAFEKWKKQQYDSAIFFSQKMLKQAIEEKSEYGKIASYYRLGLYHRKNLSYDSAKYYNDKFLGLAERINDTLKIIEARKSFGFLYKQMDSTKLSVKNFTEVNELNLKIGDTIQAGKSLLEIANVLKKSENFGASELAATKGLKYLEDSKELKSIVGLYLVLITDSRELNRIKAANDYANKGIDILINSRKSQQNQGENFYNAANIKESIDTTVVKKVHRNVVGMLLNGKANVLRDLKKYEKAIAYYKLATEYYTNNLLEAKRTQFNLAHTLFLKNGYTSQSDSLLNDSYEFYVQEDKNQEIFSTLLKLAVLYKDVDEERTLAYINKALQSAEKRKREKAIHEVLRLKITVSTNTEELNRFLVLDDKLKSKKEDLDYFYIHNRFNYEDEEQQKIKAENARFLADKKTSERTTQLLSLSLFLILLIVLTFLIYQRIKRRHKIEKVKTVHVTEARISSKVHDELANDLYELMTQLETANPEKETVLDKLDTIYNQARDISKQIQTVETDHRFPEELNNLFRSYQSDEVNVLLKRYDTDIWKGISSHIKVTVYRVLQEFLTNMKKHSNAALVVVSIEKQNKQLFIQYIDNGKGFTTKTSKNGLLNAENRIRAIKGKLTFDTELDKGCKFSINVPV
ncbi:hypothetical protein EZY14_008560 [Kordia sp. TARA_039_SRF]|nr:hypothetical protein EZY14_008560 [Kordia sp. TARA_039_SRF]